MSSYPILFNGAMVHAVLAGRKSQTRRVVKPQPGGWIDEAHGFQFRGRAAYDLENPDTDQIVGFGFQDDLKLWRSPYGKPKDRLWVRECWNLFDSMGNEWPRGGGLPKSLPDGWHVCYGEESPRDGQGVFPWRPSIHMPRWASRIALEVTHVCVEQVQDISEDDACAEGVEGLYLRVGTSKGYFASSKAAFRHLWRSINDDREGCSWSDNPWVWVIEFKLIEGGGK